MVIKDIRWPDGHLKIDQKDLYLSCAESDINGKFATQDSIARCLMMGETIISGLITGLYGG